MEKNSLAGILMPTKFEKDAAIHFSETLGNY